jgi:3',5'-cyclic-AMP phosphodiesterase
LGTLGDDQLEWLEKDVTKLGGSTPIVVFAHVPLWAVYPQWGWATGDGERALSQPAPGAGSSPWPMTVPADRLRSVLVRDVTFVQGQSPLAIVGAMLG